MFDPRALLCERLKGVNRYMTERDRYHGKKPILMDNGENPYAPSIQGRYYDNNYTQLYNEVAKLKGVQPEQLIVGTGTDQVIDMLVRAFCEPNQDSIIVNTPTFGMYAYYALLSGVGVNEVPLTEGFQLDVEAVKAATTANTKLLFLCSPNNPTGNRMRPEDLETLIKTFPGIVVLDEAYIDFTPEHSLLPRLAEFPNLIILHTFSKAWGMAGLRVGFGIASSVLIGALSVARPPYNIGSLSVQAVLENLPKADTIAQQAKRMVSDRMRMTDAVLAMGIFDKIYPSDVHFILARCPKAEALAEYLMQQGILIRHFGNKARLENCFRISVGTEAENEKLLANLQAFV